MYLTRKGEGVELQLKSKLKKLVTFSIFNIIISDCDMSSGGSRLLKRGSLVNTYLYISGYDFWKGEPGSTYSPACKINAKNSFCIFTRGRALLVPLLDLTLKMFTYNHEIFWNKIACIAYRELIEMDRNKLSQQNTQLFNDLEKSRETVQLKNKENLKVCNTESSSLKQWLIQKMLKKHFILYKHDSCLEMMMPLDR